MNCGITEGKTIIGECDIDGEIQVGFQEFELGDVGQGVVVEDKGGIRGRRQGVPAGAFELVGGPEPDLVLIGKTGVGERAATGEI